MSWTAERARVASLTRSRPSDDPELLAARQRLRTDKLAEHVARVVGTAPPLTTEQRNRIAVALWSPTEPDASIGTAA